MAGAGPGGLAGFGIEQEVAGGGKEAAVQFLLDHLEIEIFDDLLG